MEWFLADNQAAPLQVEVKDRLKLIQSQWSCSTWDVVVPSCHSGPCTETYLCEDSFLILNLLDTVVVTIGWSPWSRRE